MAVDGIVGTPIRDRFWTGVPGETFTVNLAVYGALDTNFASGITFSAIGSNGDYNLIYTPAVAATYFVRWTGNLSLQSFTETYEIATGAVAGGDPLASLLSAYANLPGTAGKALLQIGSLSVAQLPLATGTGGAAIWTKQTP